MMAKSTPDAFTASQLIRYWNSLTSMPCAVAPSGSAFIARALKLPLRALSSSRPPISWPFSKRQELPRNSSAGMSRSPSSAAASAASSAGACASSVEASAAESAVPAVSEPASEGCAGSTAAEPSPDPFVEELASSPADPSSAEPSSVTAEVPAPSSAAEESDVPYSWRSAVSASA